MVVFQKFTGIVLFLLAGQMALAQSAHQLLRRGDNAYDKSNYAEAEEAYRQADTKKKNDLYTTYNTGNALYQQSHYDQSESFFRKSAELAQDPAAKADALHNLGNAFLKQRKFKEAVEAYQNSLRQRPGDPQTKANLQLAKKQLKQQQEQQQNQGQQPQDQQQPSDQQQQQQQPQPGQNQDQNQPQQPNEQPNQQPDQQQEQPADGQMTREQARRLLETAVSPADQKNARKYRELDPGTHQTRPKKDW